ncbi:MAG: TetR family transcriptional regulator, partial [Dongiaceae bacterium]
MVKKATRRAAPKADLPERILARALALAATRGWGSLALADIAAAAKVSMAELYVLYPSKPALVAAFLRDTDRRVLAGLEAEPPEGSARDRLFDVLMR